MTDTSLSDAGQRNTVFNISFADSKCPHLVAVVVATDHVRLREHQVRIMTPLKSPCDSMFETHRIFPRRLGSGLIDNEAWCRRFPLHRAGARILRAVRRGRRADSVTAAPDVAGASVPRRTTRRAQCDIERRTRGHERMSGWRSSASPGSCFNSGFTFKDSGEGYSKQSLIVAKCQGHGHRAPCVRFCHLTGPDVEAAL